MSFGDSISGMLKTVEICRKIFAVLMFMLISVKYVGRGGCQPFWCQNFLMPVSPVIRTVYWQVVVNLIVYCTPIQFEFMKLYLIMFVQL